MIYSLLSLTLVFLLVAAAIQYPSVQTWLTQKAAGTLSENLGVEVKVGGVDIDFFKTMVLEEVFIEDQSSDTLIYAGYLGVDIGVFALLKSNIFINKIKLENSYVNLYQGQADSAFNYQFILNNLTANKPVDTTNIKPFDFGIGEIELENVRFSIHDEKEGRFNLNTNISELLIAVGQLDFDNQLIELRKFNLSNSRIHYAQLEQDSSAVVAPELNDGLSFPGFGWTILSDKIRLNNNHIIYFDKNQPEVLNTLDYSHLDLTNSSLEITDFKYADDGIKGAIVNISFSDRSGFQLNKLSGEVGVLPNGIFLENVVLETPKSELQNSTQISFKEFKDLSDFMDKVNVESNFEKSLIDVHDLWQIAPFLSDISGIQFPPKSSNQPIILSGKISLKEQQISLQRLSFLLDNQTTLFASGSISQISSDPFYDLHVNKLSTSYRSLNNWTKELELPGGLEGLGQIVLSGNIAGSKNKLSVKNLLLETESCTHFHGDLKLVDVADIDKAIFELDIKNLASCAADLKGFSSAPIPPAIDSLGLVQFSGKFNGTVKDFFLDGKFVTAAGNSFADLEIDFTDDYSNAIYNGNISVDSFDLGKLLSDTLQFGRVTMEAKINGSGLELDSLDSEMNGLVKMAVFNNYKYHDLKIDGRFVQRFFEGNMKMQDKNLSFDLRGKVNLNDSLPDIDAVISIDTVNLKNLNLFAENIAFSGKVNARLKGNHPDNFDGTALLTNFSISSNENKYFDKNILLEAKQLKEAKRSLKFSSDFLKANVTGSFNFEDLPDLVAGYIEDFFPIEDLTQSADSTFLQNSNVKDQQFDFNFQFTDLAALIGVFVPDLQELDTTAYLRGNFNSREKELNLDMAFPKLSYKGATLDSFSLKMNGNRRRLRSNLALRNLNVNDAFYAPYFNLNSRIGGDTLRFDLAVKDDSLNHLFKWGGKSTEMPEDYLLVMDQVLVLNEGLWAIDPANQIRFSSKTLSFSDLAIEKENQSITINSRGVAPAYDMAPIEIRFNNFDIMELSELLNNPVLQLSGATNGGVTIVEPQKNLHYHADLTVADMMLNGQTIGNFSVKASQQPGVQIVNLLSTIDGENALEIKGNYDLLANQFDIKANVEKLNIAIADPFLTELIEDSKGFVSGGFALTGSPEQPSFNGHITTHDISTDIVMTGSRYSLGGQTIQVSDYKIDLGNLSIFDESGRKATLSGQINHAFFDDIKFDLQAHTEGLNVLNTSRKDNPLYYGRLFASADVQIKGSPDLPKLTVVATTLDSSLLHVEPLLSELVVVQEDYVIFANPAEYEPESLNELEQQALARGGFDLALTLIVTPSAKLNVIIDPLTGDELFCTGNGNFTVLMNPAGDLNITGTYVIEKGQYSFAYEGLVKRDFEIRKGSSLSLAGDPYDARFDITAVYKTRATTYELISNESTLDDATLASSQRRADVEVLMNIDGGLAAPEITFDIALPQSLGSTVDNLVARKLNDLRDEPTELNKQVFGLLFFNSFIQSETGAGLSNVGENAALKSVSSLISSQLNRLAGRLIKGVDLTLGFESYKTGGQDATTVSELQVGLSKQLFNDRLTIQVGGNLNLENSQQSAVQEGGYSAIAGDFVLEYKLNERGSYLMKVFHKSDYNALLGGNSNKTGVGLIFRKSY